MANSTSIQNYSKYIINREISWLHFNARVLQEAIDPATPLIERIKFLGIFSNNRDEFFRVRVASLKRIVKIDKEKLNGKNDKGEVLSQIKDIVAEQEKTFTEAYFEIVKELAAEGIYIINEKELDEEQGKFVKQYYQVEMRQYLFPMMLDNFQKITSIKDGSIYLAVELKCSNHNLEDSYALVKIPQKTLSRFLILPKQGDKHYIILMDDVIRYCLEDIFAIFGYDTFHAYTIKITRDAELDIDEDISKSFLEKMSDSLKQRKKGEAVRFVYDTEIPEKFLNKITKKLKISGEDSLRGGGRIHNFKDFMSFPKTRKVGRTMRFLKKEKPSMPRKQKVAISLTTAKRAGATIPKRPMNVKSRVAGIKAKAETRRKEMRSRISGLKEKGLARRSEVETRIGNLKNRAEARRGEIKTRIGKTDAERKIIHKKVFGTSKAFPKKRIKSRISRVQGIRGRKLK